MKQGLEIKTNGPNRSISFTKKETIMADTLEDAKGHAAPRGTIRERKKSCRYQGYLATMSTIV